jgi:competence protein ComEC
MITASAGIASICLLRQLPSVPLIGLALLASALLAFRSKHAALLLWFVAGMAWGVHYGYNILAMQLPTRFEGLPVWVEGRVIGLPQSQQLFSKPSQRFQLQLLAPLCLQQQPDECSNGVKRLQLRWYQGQQLKPGQHWRLLVKLKRPYGMANPGGFDYQSWLIQQQLGGVGYVRPSSDNQMVAEQHWHIDRLRWQIAAAIDRHSESLSHSALLKALLIGDKRAVTSEQWAMFAATGTSHLMVISGLHVGLISALVYTVCRVLVLLLCRRCAAERWAGLAALVAALAYALAAGFSLPTQRALVMIAVVMLVLLFRRHIAPLNGLAAAMLACLIIDPLAPVSASFWLSFTAVACLFYGAIGRFAAGRQRWRWVSAQYLVFVGLLPVLAIAMGRISLLSPLANMLLVPLYSLIIIPLNFVAGLLYSISADWAVRLWWLLDQLLLYSLGYLHWLERQGSPLLLVVEQHSLLVKALAVLAVGIMLLPRGMPQRAIGLLLLLPLLVSRPSTLATGDLELTVLDVGQGLSIAVQTRHHVLVYDVGASHGPNFAVASAVLLPYLHSRGISRIDKLVISHGDNDHAGSWQQLPEAITVKQLLYGEPLAARDKLERLPCEAGQQWWWDGVQFEFLHPQMAVEAVAGSAAGSVSANNRSCVLMISSGKQRFLLPGDIERSVELQLVKHNAAALAANVIIAPHHGSASSSSWPFIKAVGADYVVFSSGYRNRFGHPRADVVERYQHSANKLFTSSDSGAILFQVKQGQLLPPVEYRQQQRRYWR